MYPSASIIGVDLGPIQPSWVPANVRFEVDDVEDTWMYQANYFDYVHIKLMVSGSIADPKKLFTQAFQYV